MNCGPSRLATTPAILAQVGKSLMGVPMNKMEIDTFNDKKGITPQPLSHLKRQQI